MTAARTVLIPAARVERWFDNFAARHGPPSYDVRGGALHAAAPDGAEAEARLPFARPYVGPGDPAALAAALRAWLEDAELRERLRSAAGERRAALSGWSATASVVAGVLAEAAA